MSMQDGASAEAYRRLVERLFLRHMYTQSTTEPRLLVGELPPQWDLPLPPGAVVIGSHIRDEFSVQVALDVPGGPEQAVAQVERSLTAVGWRLGRTMGPRRGGFIPVSTGMHAGGLYCDDQQRRHLTVTAGSGEAGFADVRLNLNSDPTNYTPCEHEHRMDNSSMDVFPVLTAPPGMRTRGGGGGGGGGSADTSVTLFGDMPVDAIEQHYREQLTAAGWRLGEYGASGRWAWSTWDFTGDRQEPWTGLLTVVEPPGATGVRGVTLQASTGPFAGQGGGSFTRFGH